MAMCDMCKKTDRRVMGECPAGYETKSPSRGDDQAVINLAVTAVRIYAETHPRPPHVTQTQAAAMLGLSRPTLSRMVKFGTFTLNACGLIPIHQVDAAVAERKAKKSA